MAIVDLGEAMGDRREGSKRYGASVIDSTSANLSQNFWMHTEAGTSCRSQHRFCLFLLVQNSTEQLQDGTEQHRI